MNECAGGGREHDACSLTVPTSAEAETLRDCCSAKGELESGFGDAAQVTSYATPARGTPPVDKLELSRGRRYRGL